MSEELKATIVIDEKGVVRFEGEGHALIATIYEKKLLQAKRMGEEKLKQRILNKFMSYIT